MVDGKIPEKPATGLCSLAGVALLLVRAEGGQALAFIAISREHLVQVSALQRLRNPFAGRYQLQFASSMHRRDQKSYQNSQAAAVNIINPAQVDQHLGSADEQLNQTLAEGRGFITKHDSPYASHDKYITGNLGGYFQQCSPHAGSIRALG